MLGRSNALSMDGRRKQPVAWGRGRIDVDAVVAGEKRGALLDYVEGCVEWVWARASEIKGVCGSIAIILK